MRSWRVRIWVRSKLEQPETIWIEADNHFVALVRALCTRGETWHDMNWIDKVEVVEAEKGLQG